MLYWASLQKTDLGCACFYSYIGIVFHNYFVSTLSASLGQFAKEFLLSLFMYRKFFIQYFEITLYASLGQLADDTVGVYAVSVQA